MKPLMKFIKYGLRIYLKSKFSFNVENVLNGFLEVVVRNPKIK